VEIGIGLPNAVRGVDRAGVVEWAQRAEQAGFSSLGTIDRLVYLNYESLISLAAAAAVTERIRCFPASPRVEQVDLLAEAALG
jgi:alkanesulfonate monooxygenase SsuD/methylene tetrahydromethanopterin reductase-like flavin-dependent oxidoreductase (luciferase family)